MNLETLINTSKLTPSVSLIISTEKSFPHYLTDEKRTQSLLKTIKNELIEKFTENQSSIVISKIEKLISSIDHKHLSKAIAIFASPEKERLVYLPFSIEEKFIIDSSFEVRDLFYSIYKNVDYMVVMLDSHKPEIYYGYNTVLVKAKVDELPTNVEEMGRDYPTRVSNFSDPNEIKEIELDKYLREIDHVVSELISEIDLPVIICGSKRSIGHFKKITKNTKHIEDYVEGNYNEASKEEIYKAIEVVIFEKGEKNQKELMNTLEDAMSDKKCVYGIKNVWRAAAENRGGKLIVEKDYICKALLGSDEYSIITDNIDVERSDIIQDAVDDVIERVVKSGGEISFVNNGKLGGYDKIALVTYY